MQWIKRCGNARSSRAVQSAVAVRRLGGRSSRTDGGEEFGADASLSKVGPDVEVPAHGSAWKCVYVD